MTSYRPYSRDRWWKRLGDRVRFDAFEPSLQVQTVKVAQADYGSFSREDSPVIAVQGLVGAVLSRKSGLIVQPIGNRSVVVQLVESTSSDMVLQVRGSVPASLANTAAPDIIWRDPEATTNTDGAQGSRVRLVQGDGLDAEWGATGVSVVPLAGDRWPALSRGFGPDMPLFKVFPGETLELFENTSNTAFAYRIWLQVLEET